ncbi:MAG: serine/threonine-protein kinase [Pseudomonadota bacterium]
MSIDKASWERVQSHFDELIDLEPTDRSVRLKALTLSDEDRSLLESLLASHDQRDPLLDSGSAPSLLALGESDEAEEDWTGRSLGPWQVEEQIGRGGMSVVHRGQRADGQFDKTVAIKVLDAEQLAADQRHRLTEEIRILARLEHPGLARLIDSGQSDDGDPYLVMEYVSGIPLNDHVDEQQLPVGERIKLIIQIARALQYAHQRQVIHCDVKPSNILVTAQGVAKVVDFGIASLDHAEPGNEARLYCSPAYAAPERLLGAAPTTSQDVFALGAVMYRMLSGRNIRPHDAMTGTHITEQPTPPSVATTQSIGETNAQPIHARELEGDLDAICMKAIAVDPDDRYASLSELILDLEAWQDHRPVSARNGGRVYVLSRWLRRHTAIAALGVLLVGALITGTVVSLDQARRASEQAERAVASRDFLIGILEAADPTLDYGYDPTASELLRRGAEQIQGQLEDQPTLLVELLHIIGKTQLERGLIDDARTSLDRAIERMGADRDHRDAASILASRGLVAYEDGLYEESVPWLEQAVSAAEDNQINKEDRHGILVQLADMHAVNLQTEEAVNVAERVLSEQPEFGNRVAAMRVKGMAMDLGGDMDGAEVVLSDALEQQRSVDPEHISAALIENDLAIVYWRQGRAEESLAMHQSSWRHKEAIFGENHPQTMTSLGNVAAITDGLGRHEEAKSIWLDSLERHRALFGPDHPSISYTHGMLALNAYLTDDLAGSREQMDEAYAVRSRLPEVTHQIDWLDYVDAIVHFEIGEAIDPERLGVTAEDCIEPAARRPLGQRLCVAWWILTAERQTNCPSDSTKGGIAELLSDWPERWVSRWETSAALCAEDSTAADSESS